MKKVNIARNTLKTETQDKFFKTLEKIEFYGILAIISKTVYVHGTK